MIATMLMAPRNHGIVRLVFQDRPLKLGYFTVLTIRKDNRISRAGRNHFQLPSSICFLLKSSSSNVMEQITPAAAGMGQPVKSLLGLPFGADAATQLKRARRIAPHRM